METSDIESFLELGYWPVISPTKNGNKWKASIYKKVNDNWNISNNRVFDSPFKAYEWAIEYLTKIYYIAEK
jgi:hypothetical protein